MYFVSPALIAAASPSEAGGDLPDPVQAHSVDLDPWESRTVTMSGTVPADATTGEVHIVRLVQRIGPVVVGGYSIALIVG